MANAEGALSILKVESAGMVFKSLNKPTKTNAPPAPGPLLPLLVAMVVPLNARSHLLLALSEAGIILLVSKL